VVACLHAAGVTVATYRKWEKGGHIRGMHALDNLCYELEVSICWLLDGWGSFLTEDDPEFEDFDEFLAWSWRGALGGVRMALARGQAGIAPTAGN
jgi:transcriptional regulator with XRE-family HTH domain